ncbi:MAG: hypothetical protein II457_05565 [Paludibacteraceae bacterium]|nr:hypothetical protein [Paludibacteraceae bacterium]
MEAKKTIGALKHVVLVVVIALLAACGGKGNGQEVLLKDYEKACAAGDFEKAEQLIEQMDQQYPNEADWTEEQQERIIKATLELSSQAEDFYKALEEGLEDLDEEDILNALDELDEDDLEALGTLLGF